MEPLTRGQQAFASTLAGETGLDPHVIGAWLKAEQSGSAAQNYEKQGYHNWLNIARTDGGDARGAHSQVWRDPVSAGRATAEWLKGTGRIAHEYGTPAPGIRAILHTAGQGAENQIRAIAGSGWASSGYEHGNTLREGYHELSGRNFTATQRAAGAAAGTAPVVPERPSGGPPAQGPNVIDEILQYHTPAAEPGSTQATIAHNWDLLKHLFDPNEEIAKNAGNFEGGAPALALPGEKGGTAERALKWATAHLGKFAETQGNNLGPELDSLEKQFGMMGEPWCAIFATTVASQGGMSHGGRTASVAQINQWAKEGSHGYAKGLRSSSTAKPGDLLTFGDSHVAVVKEVQGGRIITIEGNANGSGGVVQLSHLVGEGQIARPIYHG